MKQTLAYDDQNPFHYDLDFYSPPSTSEYLHPLPIEDFPTLRSSAVSTYAARAQLAVQIALAACSLQ